MANDIAYDSKKEHLIIEGVNITGFGETIFERTYTGAFTETRSGGQGDVITDKKWDTHVEGRLTVLPTSPVLAQLEAWAKARLAYTMTYKNDNTGEVITTNYGYIQNVGAANGSAYREFTVHFAEQV